MSVLFPMCIPQACLFFWWVILMALTWVNQAPAAGSFTEVLNYPGVKPAYIIIEAALILQNGICIRDTVTLCMYGDMFWCN